MCGIAGQAAPAGGPGVSRAVIQRMTSMLAHRGPDDSGLYLAKDGRAGLGHRRLSIIDLAGGHQPMSNEDGSVWLVYNGEVYNFQELRAELEAKGHLFRTRSDTEVIVHLYEEDGPDCVHKLNGMFAFAVWDEKLRRLLLARDRLGIKPLYYSIHDKKISFASTVRAAAAALAEPPRLDMDALWSYLVIQYVPAPRTLLSEVRELRPGHVLTMDEKEWEERRYWSLPEPARDLAGKEAGDAVRELFFDSVKKRLVADVPLGAFLSGGIDSTSLVAAVKREAGEGLKTFSVDFHAELGAGCVNETRWSELASREFGADHYALTVSAADVIEALPKVLLQLDDLISDPAVVPTYLVSRFARDKITVALSGEGGDELFAGYQRYRLGFLTRPYNTVPRFLTRALIEAPASRLPRMRRVQKGLAALSAPSPVSRHLAWLMLVPPDTADSLIGPGSRGREIVEEAFSQVFEGQRKAYDLDRTLRADIQTWLPDDLLTKVDRASMAVALECRVPFLDHRLVELCTRIPPEDKADLFSGKKVFKRAMRGVIPDEIINRKKAGFTLPLDQWFRSELREMVTDLLSEDRIKKQGVFDPAAVGRMLSAHLSGRENMGHQLFSLLIFQMWRDSIEPY